MLGGDNTRACGSGAKRRALSRFSFENTYTYCIRKRKISERICRSLLGFFRYCLAILQRKKKTRATDVSLAALVSHKHSVRGVL